MPRIENVITHRVITRTSYAHASSAGPSLTLRDVKMPRKGNLDDLRPDEPSMLDAYQRSVLADIRQRQKFDRFVAKLPPVNLRPRLIRPTVAPVDTISDASAPDARVSEPRKAPTASLYNRHGLTSRGRKLPAGTFKPEPERIVSGAVVYAPLPAQGTRFYRVKVKE